MVWPEIDPDYRDQVIEYLFQQIDVNTENTERFFNRSHVLKDRWRSLGFDWSTIEPELKQMVYIASMEMGHENSRYFLQASRHKWHKTHRSIATELFLLEAV